MIQFCKVPNDIPASPVGFSFSRLFLFILMCFFGHEIFILEILNDFFPISPLPRQRNDDATMIWYCIPISFGVKKKKKKEIKMGYIHMRNVILGSGFIVYLGLLVAEFDSYAFFRFGFASTCTLYIECIHNMCVSLFLFFCSFIVACVELSWARFASNTPSLKIFTLNISLASSILYDCI